MIVINKSIKNHVYEELIKYAFNKCNVVMFVSKEIMLWEQKAKVLVNLS